MIRFITLPGDEPKPVPAYKFNWFECILAVVCVFIALAVIYGGIIGVFILWGILPGIAAISSLVAVIYIMAHRITV